MKFKLKVNDNIHEFNVAEDTPLLWVIRDQLNLTGTKFGCGIGQCGACSVHIDGHLARSCITPISSVVNKSIKTIEGLSTNGHLTPVQKAWIKHDVPQCGYCQSGQIMAATQLLKETPNPTDKEIQQTMTNICRCGTYVRIKKAINEASKMIATEFKS